VILTLTLELT
jgi:hypothetical protein